MERTRQVWDNLPTNRKNTIVIVALIAFFILPIVGVLIYRSIFSATITLTFAPKSADVVKIGNVNARFGDNRVIPGDYEVVIEKKGFEGYKGKVSIKAGESKSVEVALNSNDPSTADWYQKNIEDYSIAQGIGDRRAEAARKHMQDSFPAYKDLPIVGLYDTYRVDYGLSPKDNKKYILVVSYNSDAYKSEAIKQFEQKGYSIKDYEVQYIKNKPPISQGISIDGSVAFLESGLSSNTVGIINDKISSYYKNKSGTGSGVVYIENVNQVINIDNENYTANLRFNNQTQTLRIDTSLHLMTIKIDSEVIYDNAREMF